MCLRIASPAINRVASGGYRPVLVSRTEPFIEKAPVDLPPQHHQRMAKVDVLVETSSERIPLPISRRFISNRPTLPSETVKSCLPAEIKLQENRRRPSQILLNPIL
jgi:hypothetical protein